MSTTDQFLSLQTSHETKIRLHLPGKTKYLVTPDAQQHSFASALLPIGWDENGKSLSLNLYDPASGPVLLAGESGCGKTSFLQSLAVAADSLLDVQFGILTPFPEQWHRQEILPGCLGVWSSEHSLVNDFLAHLVSLAQVLPHTRQAILLLVDGLDRMLLEPAALQSFHWLLAHGPTAHVFPIVSADSRRLACVLSFIKFFQARILGHLTDDRWMRFLSGDSHLDLAALIPGIQFQLIHSQGNMRFSITPASGV